MRKQLYSITALAGLAAGTALALAETDYTSVPKSAETLEAGIKSAAVTLGEAIRLAEKDAGGTALSADFDLSGDSPKVMVVLVGAGGKKEVTVDAANAEVLASAVIPRFPGDPVEGEPKTTDSGLMYYDVAVGDGPKPAGPEAVVTVHYSGWFTNGELFDSSVRRGQPAQFPLNRVIPGWTEGVGSMRVGGKRKLIIPYHLAYGEQGRPGAIPPKATLVFDVELLGIEE